MPEDFVEGPLRLDNTRATWLQSSLSFHLQTPDPEAFGAPPFLSPSAGQGQRRWLHRERQPRSIVEKGFIVVAPDSTPMNGLARVGRDAHRRGRGPSQP